MFKFWPEELIGHVWPSQEQWPRTHMSSPSLTCTGRCSQSPSWSWEWPGAGLDSASQSQSCSDPGGRGRRAEGPQMSSHDSLMSPRPLSLPCSCPLYHAPLASVPGGLTRNPGPLGALSTQEPDGRLTSGIVFWFLTLKSSFALKIKSIVKQVDAFYLSAVSQFFHTTLLH